MRYSRILMFLASFAVCSAQASVTNYFNSIHQDPLALYTFFKSMPKGGELHYHLLGSAYAESMIAYAAQGEYCLNRGNFVLTKKSGACSDLQAKELLTNPSLYEETVRSWSLKDFVPGQESAFEHFFSSFPKYLSVGTEYEPQLLAQVIQRAAEQHEKYMEILILPDQARSLQFASLLKDISGYKMKREALLQDAAFKENIRKAALAPETLLQQTRQELSCSSKPEIPACAVHVRFQAYVLREQPIDSVFAQAVTAFEIVSRSHGALVGVNLVQPESKLLSLQGYRKQMEIFNYLHTVYPQVNISLHAGELDPEAVVPEELGYHIHDAIFTGHAQRIGHGVDIAYENNAEATLNYMATHQIPVEVNLTSNQKILRVSGKGHPLKLYLAHKVPVVLSTDDEGILRTDLTRQYVQAVLEHNLDYRSIKQINRNALTYAFIPGKSLWSKPEFAEPVPECKDLQSASCKTFVAQNKKASLQWDLEQELLQFERRF